MAIKLKVRDTETVKLNVNGDSTVPLKLGEEIVEVMPAPYSGSYTVTPSEAEQTLPTEGKAMEHDVTVEAAVLQEKTRTIGMNGTYTDTPDSGYYGLSKVTTTVPQATVEANAESGFTTVEGNYKWQFRPIAKVNPAGWAVNGNRLGSYATYDAIPSGTTVTPSTSAQTIGGADTMMEGAVTVNPMPNATWRGGSRIEPAISMAVDSTTGEVSASVNTSTAISPLNGSGYADRTKTYGVTVQNDNSLQLTTQNGSTITPTTSEQTAVPAGTYTLGDVKVLAMPNGYRGASTISATWNSTKRFYTINYGSATNGYYPATQWNSIPSVEMTRVWETVTPTESTQEITPQNSYHFIDKVTVNPIPSQYIVPSGTASITANGTGIDVAQYATADVNVKPILTFGTIRPDAELIKTYSYDKYIVADEGVTYPAYTTTSTVLKASETLAETVTMSYANYNYYILERMLSIPEYSISTVGKGRCEYNVSSYLYEIGVVEPNMFITLDGSAKKYTSRTVSIVGNGMYREFYWSSSTAVGTYSSTAYGNFFTVTAPAVNSGVITLKTPVLGTRGHSTYYTSTYMNAVTDVRYQWVIEVYRVPKNNLNLDGFGQTTHIEHILDCVNNDPSHKLT